MSRPGKFDHLKPEIWRLISEGVSWADIKAQYPDLPNRTLADWISKVRNGAELRAKPEPLDVPTREEIKAGIAYRLPKDPETDLEKIKNALWDIVYDPKGKGPAVQALNILLKIELPWMAGVNAPADESEEDDSEVKVTKKVIHVHGD